MAFFLSKSSIWLKLLFLLFLRYLSLPSCFYQARKILVIFDIFATSWADFSRSFLAFFLSKSSIWLKLLFLLFLRYLSLPSCFYQARKILVIFDIFATSWADFSRSFLAFFLSKSSIWLKLLFLLFLRYLSLPSCF